MTITTEKLDEIERGLEGATFGTWRVDYATRTMARTISPAVARLDRTTVAELVRLARIGLAAEAGDNRPAIAAYLRAAAEDEGLCLRVWRAVSSEHSDDFPFLGRAAILALVEHVEAGR